MANIECFIGIKGKVVQSCNGCRTSIGNANKTKLKEKQNEEVKKCQTFAYSQDELRDLFLEFLEPFQDFDSTKPCTQVLDFEIPVFLDSLTDCIESNNEIE
ncbi:12606_t:CDS:2, partial [Racocetra fulgida]